MKYLVCVDGSENGDLAFHRATQLYVSHRDELIILLVHSGLDENREKETETIHKYSKQCIGKYNSKIVGESTTSTVGEKIIQVAKEVHADAIFMGRRGMGVVQRLFAGSVSRYVLENADCDVYVARDSQAKAKDTGAKDAKPATAAKDATAAKEATGAKDATAK